MDGSGRITHRNRQFLKKFSPVTPSLPGPSPNSSHFEPQANPTPSTRSHDHQPVVNPIPTPEPGLTSPPMSPSPQFRELPGTPESPTFVTPPSSPSRTPNLSEPVENQPIVPETPTVPRRSTRVNLGQPPDRLTYSKFWMITAIWNPARVEGEKSVAKELVTYHTS